MTQETQKRIVVVGGGFAGINVIQALANDKNFMITLVDRNNYHFFSSPPVPGLDGLY